MKRNRILLILCFALVLVIMPVLGGYAGSTAQAKEVLTVLNPKAQQLPEWEIRPLVPRPATLEGKTVYLVNSKWGGAEAQEGILLAIKAWLEKNIPNVKAVYKKKLGSYMDNDPELWKEAAEKADAAIVGMGH
jgi:hypothetical protein